MTRRASVKRVETAGSKGGVPARTALPVTVAILATFLAASAEAATPADAEFEVAVSPRFFNPALLETGSGIPCPAPCPAPPPESHVFEIHLQARAGSEPLLVSVLAPEGFVLPAAPTLVLSSGWIATRLAPQETMFVSTMTEASPSLPVEVASFPPLTSGSRWTFTVNVYSLLAKGALFGETHEVDVVADLDPPDVTAAAACDSALVGVWCPASAALAAGADDAVSPISVLQCTVDGTPQACNGLPVPPEGTTTLAVTATDAAGNVATASASVRRDVTPPAATIVRTCTDGEATAWCRGGASFSVSASDATSGVASATCDLDGAAVPCGFVAADGDGERVLRVVVRDAAGHERVAFSSLRVDGTPPTVEARADCAETGEAGWCLVAVSTQGAAADGGSGLASLACRLDDVAVPCEATAVAAEGAHVYEAVAVDAAGNERSAVASFRLDAAPPEVSWTVACPLQGEAGWCRAAAAAAAEAIDTGSGLESLACMRDGVGVDCGGFSVSSDGRTRLEARARDAAGREALAALDVTVDATPPTLSVSESCGAPGSAGWCRGAVGYSSAAADGASGLASLSCRSGATAPCAAELAADGVHTISFEARDAAGNVATETRTLRVDATPPEAILTLACALEGDDGWCRGEVAASLASSDAASGVASATCSVDHVAVECATLASGEDGTRTLRALVTDAAGNAADATVVARVDATPPDAQVVIECGALQGSWCREPFAYEGVATDAASGIVSVACGRNGAAAACAGEVSEDGVYTLTLVARDAAGNLAEAASTFGLDLMAPALVLGATCDDAGNDGWCRGVLRVVGTASDGGSGLASLACFSGDAAVDCAGFDVAAGVREARAVAEDGAGHVTSRSIETRVDGTPPTSDSVVRPAAAASGWHAEPVEVVVSAIDDASGVRGIRHSGSLAADLRLTLAGAGEHRVAWQAEDIAGNLEAERSLVVRIDPAAPVTACTIEGTRGAAAYSGEVRVVLAATAGPSGVAHVAASVDDKAFAPYAEPLRVQGAGDHVVRFRATSGAGVAEAEKTCSFRIDDSRPRTVLDVAFAAGPAVEARLALPPEAPAGAVVLAASGEAPLAPATAVRLPADAAGTLRAVAVGPGGLAGVERKVTVDVAGLRLEGAPWPGPATARWTLPDGARVLALARLDEGADSPTVVETAADVTSAAVTLVAGDAGWLLLALADGDDVRVLALRFAAEEPPTLALHAPASSSTFDLSVSYALLNATDPSILDVRLRLLRNGTVLAEAFGSDGAAALVAPGQGGFQLLSQVLDGDRVLAEAMRDVVVVTDPPVVILAVTPRGTGPLEAPVVVRADASDAVGIVTVRWTCRAPCPGPLVPGVDGSIVLDRAGTWTVVGTAVGASGLESRIEQTIEVTALPALVPPDEKGTPAPALLAAAAAAVGAALVARRRT